MIGVLLRRVAVLSIVLAIGFALTAPRVSGAGGSEFVGGQACGGEDIHNPMDCPSGCAPDDHQPVLSGLGYRYFQTFEYPCGKSSFFCEGFDNWEGGADPTCDIG